MDVGRGLTPGDTANRRAHQTRPVDTFNEDRGLTHGDTVGLQCTQCHLPTFNEGRGFTPGDTRAGLIAYACSGRRSMRAGDSPPATRYLCQPSRIRPSTFNEGRGFTPGDTSRSISHRSRRLAFNEGRGFTPGDTSPIKRTPTATSQRVQ